MVCKRWLHFYKYTHFWYPCSISGVHPFVDPKLRCRGGIFGTSVHSGKSLEMPQSSDSGDDCIRGGGYIDWVDQRKNIEIVKWMKLEPIERVKVWYEHAWSFAIKGITSSSSHWLVSHVNTNLISQFLIGHWPIFGWGFIYKIYRVYCILNMCRNPLW